MTETRLLVILVVALLLISTVGMGMGAGMMGPGMMWGYGTSGGVWWPGMALGWVAMLGFWAVVIVAGVLLVRWLGSFVPTTRRPEDDDPLAILRRRYAAGEIDQETFERMKRELTS